MEQRPDLVGCKLHLIMLEELLHTVILSIAPHIPDKKDESALEGWRSIILPHIGTLIVVPQEHEFWWPSQYCENIGAEYEAVCFCTESCLQ